MKNTTATTTGPATDWHPTWCAGDDSPACGPGMGEDAVHDGYPERIEFDEEYAEGTEFHAEVQRYFSPSPDPEKYREELGFTLRLAGGEVETVGYAILSTDRMRDLADFLFTQADQLDAWREQHRAALAAGGDAQ